MAFETVIALLDALIIHSERMITRIDDDEDINLYLEHLQILTDLISCYIYPIEIVAKKLKEKF